MNDTRYDPKPATTQPQNPRDNNASIAEPRARACQLAEYLQRKTRLQMSGVEFGLNSHQCAQKTVVLTTTLKLIGNCVDDVITWAKAIPGVIDFRDTYFTRTVQVHLFCSVAFGRTVCKTARPMLSDRCLSCSVCNVGNLWPNGWMDQDATWYGGRLWAMRHCVRWGPSSPLQRGTASPNFCPMSVVTKRLDGSRCHLVQR